MASAFFMALYMKNISVFSNWIWIGSIPIVLAGVLVKSCHVIQLVNIVHQMNLINGFHMFYDSCKRYRSNIFYLIKSSW